MRVLVCGGRDFANLPKSKSPHKMKDGGYSIVDHDHPDFPKKMAELMFIKGWLDSFAVKHSIHYNPDDNWLPSDIYVIDGGAKGVDTAAYEWAVVNLCQGKEYPADWTKYGKRAGYIRNKQMLDEGHPDLVVAFPGGAGTAMMIRLAKAAGVEVIEVKYD